MTDQLISLETAILAKEKGFNQNPYKTKNAYGPEFTNGTNIKLRSSSLFNPDSNTAVAPTQSLLQKWLREIHDIHIVIRPCMEFFYEIYNSQLGNKASELKIAQWGPDDRNTYEESLEQALFEALKLIK